MLIIQSNAFIGPWKTSFHTYITTLLAKQEPTPFGCLMLGFYGRFSTSFLLLLFALINNRCTECFI